MNEIKKGGLCITRNIGESFMIGDDIEITIVANKHGKAIRLLIKAPKDVNIARSELLENRGNVEI